MQAAQVSDAALKRDAGISLALSQRISDPLYNTRLRPVESERWRVVTYIKDSGPDGETLVHKKKPLAVGLDPDKVDDYITAADLDKHCTLVKPGVFWNPSAGTNFVVDPSASSTDEAGTKGGGAGGEKKKDPKAEKAKAKIYGKNSKMPHALSAAGQLNREKRLKAWEEEKLNSAKNNTMKGKSAQFAADDLDDFEASFPLKVKCMEQTLYPQKPKEEVKRRPRSAMAYSRRRRKKSAASAAASAGRSSGRGESNSHGRGESGKSKNEETHLTMESYPGTIHSSIERPQTAPLHRAGSVPLMFSGTLARSRRRYTPGSMVHEIRQGARMGGAAPPNMAFCM